MGASKCVPACSPVEMLFQYQAGPRSSYRLISCKENPIVLPNGSGSLIRGVSGLSGAVRSITSMVLRRSAATSVSRTGIANLPWHGTAIWAGNQACRSPARQGRSTSKPAICTVHPRLGQPRLGQPRLGQPRLGQPRLGQPRLGQPRLGHPRSGAALLPPGERALGRSVMKSVAGAGVVVTGAGSGIGAALARRFVARGGRDVLNDLNAAAGTPVAEASGQAGAGGGRPGPADA